MADVARKVRLRAAPRIQHHHHHLHHDDDGEAGKHGLDQQHALHQQQLHRTSDNTQRHSARWSFRFSALFFGRTLDEQVHASSSNNIDNANSNDAEGWLSADGAGAHLLQQSAPRTVLGVECAPGSRKCAVAADVAPLLLTLLFAMVLPLVVLSRCFVRSGSDRRRTRRSTHPVVHEQPCTTMRMVTHVNAVTDGTTTSASPPSPPPSPP